MLSRGRLAAALALALSLPACSQTPESKEPAVAHAQLQTEATQLYSIAKSKLSRQFLANVHRLPVVFPRVIYRNENRTFISQDSAVALSPKERAALERVEIDGDRFYTTKYGTVRN